MATEAKTTNYWISNSALYIQLNATGEPNRIQASVVSGASILCYMQGIDGLGYDAGHNYQRWTLAAYPSEFPSDEERYVYVAIPRQRTTGNDIATIVFPSQKIDIYGKAIVLKTDKDGKQEEVVGDQIGSEDYYYIYLQGIISEVYLNEANDRIRRWVQDVDFGSLSTDEALASGGVAQWWKYNSVSDTITFLKTIFSATFESLVARTIRVTELFFGKEKKITGIASDESKEDSEEVIVTPKYGNRNYLSKIKDDIAEGLITFVKGLITDALKSLDYDNAAEQGFSVEKEKNGKYHAFITNLTIWGKAIFHELEVRKLSYSGGNIYLSGAGSKLIEVVPVKQSVSADGVTTWVKTTEDDAECVGWKCYLLADNGTTATMNYWQEGDQVRCQTMGEIASGGTYADASNKSYWRTIPKDGVSTQNEKIYGTKTETYLDEAGKEKTREVQVELYGGQSFAWIVVGKHSKGFDGCTEGDSKTAEIQGHPAEGDTIVLDGNRHRNGKQEYDKTDRQNVIILETIGEYAPRIACYANITEYKHTITKSVNNENKEVSLSVFETSPKGGTKINSSRFEWISSDGSTINIINYRGDWVKGNTYHKNDQVNYNNAVWVCVANSEESVIAEPSDSSTQWKKVLSGGKGEKGDDAVSYSVQFSEGADTISGVTTKVLNVTFVKSIGLQIRSGGIRDIDFNGTCVVYVDGVRNDGMTNNLMFGYTYLDIYNAFANEIKGKKSLSVELRDSDNRVVASNIFFFAEKGEKGDQGDKGEDGVDGTDGKDAISILIEDAPLVFDTDDNGIVPVSISKVAKVKVMKGNLNISNECSNINSRDDLCVNCKCGATQKTGYIEVSVSGSNIAKNDVVIDGVNQGKVSATSGYAVIQLTYNGVTYFPQVPFSVNVAKFTGVVAFNNKSYKIQFDELSKNAATKDELTKATSKFEQTARKISLSVSEKTVGRRNLLVGSAFRRQGEISYIVDSHPYFIRMNDGYGGTNCAYMSKSGMTQNVWCGAMWNPVKVKPNTKYTFSMMVKVTSVCDERFDVQFIDVTSNSSNSVAFDTLAAANNTETFGWTLKKITITTPSSCTKLRIDAFVRRNGTAYMCRPMLEEGDYNGWTLSTEDYDYVGGNMLDNTLSLDKSGTLYEVNGTLTPLGFGESTSIYKSFAYKLKGTVSSFSQLPSYGNTYGDTYYVSNTETCYRYNGSEFENVGNDYYYNILQWGKLESGGFVPFGLEANKDYVFSFMAKGTGKLSAYFYNPDTNVFVESSLGVTENNVNGQANFLLTSDWKKYWVHWRPSDSAHKYVLLRLNRTIQSSAGDAPITDCYIAQPKLEAGAVVTEYTERKSDLVDKASLKKAGIEVKSDEVLLYGDKIRVDNNGQTAAMFTDGKLNANLIDADKIEVKHLWAKSEDGATKVGYFGNYEIEACKVGDTYAPLFVGADTADKAPFRVSNKGHMVSTSATLGSFLLDSMSLRYLTGYDEQEPGFALYNNYMVFRGYNRLFNSETQKWVSERKRLVWLGEYKETYSVPGLTSNLLIDDSFSVGEGILKTGLRISVTGCNDSYQYSNVFYNGSLDSKVYGNFAIYAENGMYAGLRPAVRRVDVSLTLTEFDHTIVCVNKSEITLTLPSNPQRGQCYVIIQREKKVYIHNNKNNIVAKDGVYGWKDWYSDTFMQETHLFFDGVEWNLTFFN